MTYGVIEDWLMYLDSEDGETRAIGRHMYARDTSMHVIANWPIVLLFVGKYGSLSDPYAALSWVSTSPVRT